MSELPRRVDFGLSGRRAIVTGASSGIGFAIAAGLADAGAEVTLVARTAQALERGVSLITDAGGCAQASMLDVRETAAVQSFFTERPAFHIVINNAGTNRPKPMLDVTEDDYDTVLDLNLRSAFFVAQAAVRRMIGEGVQGSLIHIGSQMGHVGGVDRTIYCASKWGLEGMSKAISLDVARHGIRSNTIAPTFIRTPMTDGYLGNPVAEHYILDRIKLGRFGEVEDIIGAALFLASDASSLMTGSSLVIDGGWTAD